MKKMKTLFVVDRNTGLASDVVRPECEWIFEDNVTVSIKFDGTAAFFKDGILYKRFDRKLKDKFQSLRKRLESKGEVFVPKDFMFRDLPDGAIPCEEEPDLVTFHFPHWVPVDLSLPENKWFNEATKDVTLEDNATYELVGPCIQNNVYNLTKHELWKHGSKIVSDLNFDFQSIKSWLKNNNHEGLVFNKGDKFCKIRKKDFSLNWNKENLRK